MYYLKDPDGEKHQATKAERQKLEEAQMISEAVLDAEVRIGALTAAMPKATPNNNPYHEIDTAVVLVKPKSEAIRELGFTPKQAERFETLAKHPEIVEQAKAEARENDDKQRYLMMQRLYEQTNYVCRGFFLGFLPLRVALRIYRRNTKKIALLNEAKR